MALQTTVELALKDKAPKLHAALKADGKLGQYVADLASQISSETVSLTQEQRARQKWDRLGPLECAAKMRTAQVLNREAAMAHLLEFPQDETSPPSPAETTGSTTPT